MTAKKEAKTKLHKKDAGNVAPACSELLFYQTEDGKTRLQVRLEGETVWLTQAQMAELFQTSVPNVSMHIRNVFEENELRPDSVVKEFLTTAADGKNYVTRHFNLDAGKPNMGLTSWSGSKVRKTDILVAKNYLNKDDGKRRALFISYRQKLRERFFFHVRQCFYE